MHGAHREEVLEPSGAGDDELGAGVERLALRAVADAAVHRDDVVAAAAGERAQLGRRSARRAHGSGRARAPWAGGAAPAQVGDEGDAEGERLAGAGRGAAGDVAPGEGVGDDGGLDRERFGDPGASRRAHKIRARRARRTPGKRWSCGGDFLLSRQRTWAGTTERLRAASGAVGTAHPTGVRRLEAVRRRCARRGPRRGESARRHRSPRPRPPRGRPPPGLGRAAQRRWSRNVGRE